MKKFVLGLVAGLTVAAGILGVQAATRPHCPTEDSCVADYSKSHGWTITEVQP